MSNIFHELKRGFLILGFTGPLSSGCTTAAHFFEKEINTFIKRRCEEVLPRIEANLKRNYKELKELRDALDSSENKFNLHGRINRLSYKIMEKLNLRETLSVLTNYQNSNFKYISMTDVLIKLTLEIISDANEEQLNPNLLKLKNVISYNPIRLKNVRRINQKIKDREISDINEEENNLYEEFLAEITHYRENLNIYFSKDELGNLLQDLGDNARRCGNPIDFDSTFKKENAKTLFILAEEANNIIKFYRNKKRKDFKKPVYSEFVIEAFRNPYEVEYFRNRYYEFFLFSIFTPLVIRKSRGNYNQDRDKRDRGQGLQVTDFFKQNVSECVRLSDIAINNDSKKRYIFERKLSKYFSLICRPGCIPPSDDELFMQQAYCMSVKSNCISRQVGAIIIGKRGYIVGAGWNDVGSGQIPCGLRRYNDIEKGDLSFPVAIKGEEDDFAQFLETTGCNFLHQSFCFKDEYSRYKTNKVIKGDLCKENSALSNWKSKHHITEDAIEALPELISNNFTPKRLEYCRALHAEENAILQDSIIGGVGIDGATIYTTTFPCELCAKKIYQSRIRKVVYTEPYPESISEDVFFKDGSHSIELIQFEGVKSHSYYRLYKSPIAKKEFQIQERLY